MPLNFEYSTKYNSNCDDIVIDILSKILRKEVLKMKVNNCSNQVQQYYLSQSDPNKKGHKPEQTCNSFADLVNIAGDWLNGITQGGKDSKGDKQLTEAQRKYLSQKYNVKDMPASQRQSLLAELANMGALSFEDYKMSDLRPLPPEGVMLGGIYDSSTGEIKGRVYNPAADWPTRDVLAHYKTISQQETEDYDYIYHTTGKKQNNFKEFSASHSRVADLLQTLVRAN